MRVNRHRRWLIAFGWAAAAAAPPVVYRAVVPIEFNQHQIERLEIRHDPSAVDHWATFLGSMYRASLDLVRRPPRWREPAYADSLDVLDYVLSWVPSDAAAYPTEGYFYFTTTIDGRRVRGSFRLADLETGGLTFSYFPADQSERTRVLHLDANDGVRVDDLGSKRFRLTYRSRSARFQLPTIGAKPPRTFELIEDESFVARVFDESGMRFFLLLNEATNSFYYVLDEEDRVGDTLRDVGDGFVYGERTRFLFYRDDEYRRHLLVAISLDSADANDPFDGPGDQVPYDLDIRDRLHRVYPSTLAGAGVDEHGVWLDKPVWVRFAISPYLRYRNVDEVAKRLLSCNAEPNRSELWTCLTKEWWYSEDWITEIEERLSKENKARPDVPLRVHRRERS